MALPPFWLSADFMAWEFAHNVTFQGLVEGAGQAVHNFLAPVSAAATKTADINNRLKSWYTQRASDAAAPIQDLASAASGFVEDVWATGVHAYMPLPDFGGFDMLRENLMAALQAPDPNRPMFSDEMYAGGVIMLVAGGRMQVMAVAMTLSFLLGGTPDFMQQAVSDVTTVAPAFNDFAGKIQDMATKVPALWDNEQRQFMDVINNSTIAKLATHGFPLSLLDDPNVAATVDPPQVSYGSQFTLTVKGGGFTDAHKIVLAGTTFHDTQWVDDTTLTALVLDQDWFTSDFTAASLAVSVLDTSVNHPAKTVGTIAVVPATALDRLAGLAGTSVFDSWKALSVGTSVNALVPGATAVATKVTNLFDNLGNIAKDGSNILTAGLAAVGDAVTGTVADVASVTDQVDGVVTNTLDELGQMAMATMIIPPAPGGIHQLGWSLSQGLSENALNAPLIDADECVLALFIAAGDVDLAKTVASIQKFGSTFGITALANWHP